MSLKHYREEITVFFWKRIPSKSQADLSLIKLSLSVSTFYSEDELSLLYGWDLIAKSSWVFFEYQLFLLWDFNFSSPTRGSYDEVESAEIVQQCWAAHIATLLYDSPSPQREKLFKTHHVFSSPTRREMYFLFSKREKSKEEIISPPLCVRIYLSCPLFFVVVFQSFKFQTISGPEQASGIVVTEEITWDVK